MYGLEVIAIETIQSETEKKKKTVESISDQAIKYELLEFLKEAGYRKIYFNK